MRFLHTADWQIGMNARSVGAAAARVREARLEAGKRVVEEARDRSADFIVVAGDLFEDNGVDRGLVQQVADILSSFDGPVHILPGNHDPLAPGSVWEHPSWASASNLRVLRSPEPVALENCVLYPCPLTEKHSEQDPTVWIDPADGETIAIGVAHGTVEGVRQDEPDYPIPRDAAERARLDYLALGHWHSFAAYESGDGALRMAYSGAHEPTKFGERDSGKALIVEIDRPGATPSVTPVQTGRLSWLSIEREIREPGELAGLRKEIEGIDHPEAVLVDVRLLGLLRADEPEELAHARDILASRFLFGRLDESRLRPAPQDDRWIEALPAGIVRQAAERLRETASGEGRGDDAAPETATRALIELYAIAEEARR